MCDASNLPLGVVLRCWRYLRGYKYLTILSFSNSPLLYKKGDKKLYYSFQSIHNSFYFQFGIKALDLGSSVSATSLQ
ncbi:hypothetical protein CR513_20217, partial [Mucuna pruriens]